MTLQDRAVAFLLALTLGGVATGCAAGRNWNTGALYDRAEAAAVEILVDGLQAGSGWFAAGDGLVVTAEHVIHPGTGRIEVLSPTTGTLPAKVAALDKGHDLALLRASGRDAPFPCLEIAPAPPAPGAEVFLFASALYRHGVLVRGAVARRTPTFEYLSGPGHYIEVYHVSAPSPPGTSGGCWLDATGRVIGCQSGFISQDGKGLGIALVTGAEAIRRLVETRRTATVPTLGAGFEEFWSQPAGFIARFPEGTAGLVAVLPRKGGPAERAGLAGDRVIVAVDGRPVKYRDPFLRYIHSKKPGETVVLFVLEPDGRGTREVKIVLAAL